MHITVVAIVRSTGHWRKIAGSEQLESIPGTMQMYAEFARSFFKGRQVEFHPTFWLATDGDMAKKTAQIIAGDNGEVIAAEKEAVLQSIVSAIAAGHRHILIVGKDATVYENIGEETASKFSRFKPGHCEGVKFEVEVNDPEGELRVVDSAYLLTNAHP
ncbi:hypothetical protein H6786_03485 [Candidatus Nomurabacteria bacterium]|nr:hypothetical protein [Candidatus Nomurabacteria bacterium]